MAQAKRAKRSEKKQQGKPSKGGSTSAGKKPRGKLAVEPDGKEPVPVGAETSPGDTGSEPSRSEAAKKRGKPVSDEGATAPKAAKRAKRVKQGAADEASDPPDASSEPEESGAGREEGRVKPGGKLEAKKAPKQGAKKPAEKGAKKSAKKISKQAASAEASEPDEQKVATKVKQKTAKSTVAERKSAEEPSGEVEEGAPTALSVEDAPESAEAAPRGKKAGKAAKKVAKKAAKKAGKAAKKASKATPAEAVEDGADGVLVVTDEVDPDGLAVTDPGLPPEEEPAEDGGAGPQLTLIEGDVQSGGSDLLGEGEAQGAESDIEDTEAFLRGLVEAILFVSDKPLTVKEVARAAKLDKKRTQEIIDELRAEFRERGMVLHEAVGGISFRSNPRYGEYVRTHLAQRPVRLSRAQLETLAIIAYRQPITRPEIDDIRGVDCGPVLKGLLERDLVRILGKKDEPGRPMLYGTSDAFLELFSLDSLKDLPTLREFTELSEESKDKFQTELGEEAPAGPIEFDDSPAASLDEGEPMPVDADGEPTQAFRERADDESFGDDDELDAGLLGAELEELERRDAERVRRRAEQPDADADDADADDADDDADDATSAVDDAWEQPPRAQLSIEDDTDAAWDDAEPGEARGSVSIGGDPDPADAADSGWAADAEDDDEDEDDEDDEDDDEDDEDDEDEDDEDDED